MVSNLYLDFNLLEGKTLSKIKVIKNDPNENDAIIFTITDDEVYMLNHHQDCCESVTIDEVIGDVDDLIGSPIVRATEDTNIDENPGGVEVPEYQDSFTWTFYNIATAKGHVTIRWYGESNGYYSETASFDKIK